LKIGEVARQTGVSVEAIRYYERLGLIGEAPRTRSGYRRFAPGVLRRLRFIQRAQRLGFSLEQIRELLELRSSPRASAADVRRLAQAKLAQVESKLADLERIRQALLDVSCACSGRGAVSDCPILEALEDGTAEVTRATPRRLRVPASRPRS
jgi:MerR family transcriptional regulator, copper efflux regulator